MSTLSLAIIFFTNDKKVDDLFSNTIKNNLYTFFSVIKEKNNLFPHSLTTSVYFLNDLRFNSFKDSKDLISSLISAKLANFYLIGCFKSLNSEPNIVDSIHSSLTFNTYFFINHVSKELLLSDSNIIPGIFVNEFINFLFFNNDKKMEEHREPCSRMISKDSFLPGNISNSLTIDYLVKKLATNNYNYCQICSDKILIGMNNLVQKNKIDHKENITEKVVIQKEEPIDKNKEQTQVQAQTLTPVMQATRPPPRRNSQQQPQKPKET